jgi:hypothetical protein
MSEDLEGLGPLAALAGAWESEGGDDTAPDAARQSARTRYRERTTFVPTGVVDNHEQLLYGLRYARMAWKLGEEKPFHEEFGYWLYEPATRVVLVCFVLPRGLSVTAGGEAAPDATHFTARAQRGATDYGITANRFLEAEFRTERFELSVTVHGPDSFSYEEDTVMAMKGRTEPFHHVDRNTLKRVGR